MLISLEITKCPDLCDAPCILYIHLKKMHLTPKGHPPSPLGSVFDLLDHLK